MGSETGVPLLDGAAGSVRGAARVAGGEEEEGGDDGEEHVVCA